MTAESERSYWNRHARNYGRSMRLLGRPIPRMCELVSEAVAGHERVLEIAAGTGLVTEALARSARSVVATDYAPAMVDVLADRCRSLGLSNVEVEQADLFQLRFETGTFDSVVAANVLHLVPDPSAAVAALRRVVRPGGALIVPTFCHDEGLLAAGLSRVLGLSGFPIHTRFTARGFRAVIEASGLLIRRSETLAGPIPIEYVEGSLVEPR